MSEQAKLAAIIHPVLLGMTGALAHDALHYRWAGDIADAIIYSGQWVPRSALTAMSARIDAALKLHHVDTYCGGRRCVCEEDWPCATVRALAGGDA